MECCMNEYSTSTTISVVSCTVETKNMFPSAAHWHDVQERGVRETRPLLKNY